MSGPIVGECLRFLLDRVLENPDLNNPEDLIKLCKQFKEERIGPPADGEVENGITVLRPTRRRTKKT